LSRPIVLYQSIQNESNLERNRRQTMNRRLEGKIALITGGSRGIGAAIAKRLAIDGAKVAITYAKGADAAASVVKEIERDGGKAIAIQADATDAEAGKAAVEKTVETFGGLDVLVNNAGTAIPKTFEETTLEEMDRLFNINVRGVFIATQAALKHMKRGGRIIMIGSAVGERVVTPGLVPYAASTSERSNDLFTYRYETGNRGTAWTASRLRSGRGPGSRHARFLGQRLRRSFTLQSHPGHANQSPKSVRRIWQHKTAPIFEVVFDLLIKPPVKELLGCFCRVIRHPTRAAQ
jgi:3-oxoacyl-[acyl-carrier protein] reductase